MSTSVEALFVRSVPGASIGYQKYLLSLKVITSQSEQGLRSFEGGFGRHKSQWVKIMSFAVPNVSLFLLLKEIFDYLCGRVGLQAKGFQINLKMPSTWK